MRWALLCLALASCGSDEVTEIFACYGIDEALVSPESVVRICVADSADGTRFYGCEDTRLSIAHVGGVASQAILRDRAESVYLRLEGEVPYAGGTMGTVSQELVVPFGDARVVDVSLRLDARCVDRTCEPGWTCVEGNCTPIEVNARCLTNHDAEPSPECHDPRLVAGCVAPD